MPLRSPPPPQYRTVQFLPYVDTIFTVEQKVQYYTDKYFEVCLSVCLFVCLSVCLPIYLSEGSQSAGLSVSLSFFIYSGMYLPFCTTVCQSVCLCFSLPSCLLPPCLSSRQTDRRTLKYLQVLTIRQLFMQPPPPAGRKAGGLAGRKAGRMAGRKTGRQ